MASKGISALLKGEKINVLKFHVKKILNDSRYWIQDENSNCELEISNKSSVSKK